MVANNALPAAFAINRCLKDELSVESRIGCTFGKVYCGVVGGIRRHEFAVLGAPCNLVSAASSRSVRVVTHKLLSLRFASIFVLFRFDNTNH